MPTGADASEPDAAAARPPPGTPRPATTGTVPVDPGADPGHRSGAVAGAGHHAGGVRVVGRDPRAVTSGSNALAADLHAAARPHRAAAEDVRPTLTLAGGPPDAPVRRSLLLHLPTRSPTDARTRRGR